MAWRADCHQVTWSVAPLISVHSWFRLPNPDDLFYPTRTPVRLFIHHFRSLPVYHTVMSVRMVGYCRFVFDVCRTVPCFPNKTPSFYSFNFFFVFILSRTKCSSCFTDVTHIAGLTWDLVHTIGIPEEGCRRWLKC